MDQRKIEKIQGLIERGFYDDPGILAVLLDRCLEAMIRDESACGRRRGMPLPFLGRVQGARKRVRVRPTRRKVALPWRADKAWSGIGTAGAAGEIAMEAEAQTVGMEWSVEMTRRIPGHMVFLA